MMKRLTKGFTLIELIIAIAVGMILATIAVPSFQGLIERNRVTTGTNEFLTALIVTRSEAVKRGFSVSICPSNAAQSACENTNGDYARNGWIIFTDCDQDGVLDAGPSECDYDGDGITPEAEDGESIIKVNGPVKGLWIMPNREDYEDALSYSGSGRLAPTVSFQIGLEKDTGENGSINTAARKKEVSIAITGRAKTKTCKASGETVSCS